MRDGFRQAMSDSNDEDLDAYQFTAVDAEFYGFEAECAYRLYSDLDSEITWGLMADSVRATERLLAMICRGSLPCGLAATWMPSGGLVCPLGMALRI